MAPNNVDKDFQISNISVFECDRCARSYYDYRLLLEHMYWQHGMDSKPCHECGLKRWRYAAHVCHVLPIFISLPDDDEQFSYCFCGRDVDAGPMIGCDGSRCAIHWFHFNCVGIVTPPKGNWLCSACKKMNLLTQDSDYDDNYST